MSTKRFAISLSFPDENRSFVQEVATLLAESMGKDRIFYDKWYEGELIGKGGDLKLKKIYRDESDLVVPFFSVHYKKPWCLLEWDSIRSLLFARRGEDAVIPVDLDGTKIEGWELVDFAIRRQERPSIEIADLIVKAYEHRFSSEIGSGSSEDQQNEKSSRKEHRVVRVPQFHLTRFVEPKMFVGRSDEIRQAKSLLLANESVLLVGVPRSGKTSF